MSKLTILSPAVLAILLIGSAGAQNRDRMREPDYWDAAHNRYTRLAPGTMVAVRPTEPIDVQRSDNRVYMGVVDQDVRGTNGRLAIPRGSTVEMMVRVEPDHDLILDLESVNVLRGDRYAISTRSKRIGAADPGLIGSIIGAVNGAEYRGRVVRIPRNTLLTFRLDRPLEMGVVDRGVMRNGHHYHDWHDYGHDSSRR